MSDNSEGFLALFGVNPERAIGEPESIRLVVDDDDPADDIDKAERERRCHRNHSAHGWRPVFTHDQTGTSLDLPGAKGLCRATKDVVGRTECPRPPIEVVARWRFCVARDANRLVGERVLSTSFRKVTEVGFFWAS